MSSPGNPARSTDEPAALRVAIVGAGPAGSALAILLARQGAAVTLFDQGRPPALLVGESLVPAVVPILKRLDIEQETAELGLLKPGVSFAWSPVDRFSFSFAHFEGFRWDEAPGQVLIARLQAGWSWRIPLKDRLSVGIVLGREDAAGLGRTPEERLERAIVVDPWLSSTVTGGKRVTSVATYANYQLISERGSGPGWVMVGDAFGFVDPMLSPGVFLALRSAELVAEALTPLLGRRVIPSPAELASALRSYVSVQTAMLAAWMELVAYLYDGRMLALLRSGRGLTQERPGRLTSAAQNHIERHVALQASGVGTTFSYSRRLLRFLGRYGLRGNDPADLAIR